MVIDASQWHNYIFKVNLLSELSEVELELYHLRANNVFFKLTAFIEVLTEHNKSNTSQ